MRIEPELDEVVNGPRGILRGIEVCLDNECLVSSVALIFSGIDSVAALTRPVQASRTSRHTFIEWVKRYLLPGSALACMPLDLYAARCGVLHTYSHVSDLQSQGEAKPLVYKWRRGPAADATLPLPLGTIVIEVETLYEALRRAINRFFVAADTEAETKKRVQYHLKALLCYRPWPVLVANASVGR